MTNIWSEIICAEIIEAMAPFQATAVQLMEPIWGSVPSLSKIRRSPRLVTRSTLR